jgi:hypothetical protein
MTPTQFNSLTGSTHEIHLVSIGWNPRRTWDYALRRRFEQAQAGNYRLMVHIEPADSGVGSAPGHVAQGRADRYLIDMGREVNNSNQYIYVRPPAEMNGHWSTWCAFNRNGSARSSQHSTRMYRRAFIRIALIARGGTVATINKRLVANGMPRLNTTRTTLARSGKVAMVWNPQAEGSPNLRGNMPQAYYPGAQWVDYFANDIYAQNGRAAWRQHEAFYNQYRRTHPFMVAEFAPWGYDDPAFVRKMFSWVSNHRRTVALMYFNGTSGTTFQLKRKPRSLSAYRSLSRTLPYRCKGIGPFTTNCAGTL